MGQRSLRVDAARAATKQEPLVVLVAGSVEERVRVLTRLGDSASLLMVSSAEEAAALLLGGEGTSGPLADDASESADLVAAVRADWRHTGLHLVEDRRAVRMGPGEVALTPLEFGVLRSLLLGRGEVRSFAELAREVWGTSHVGDGAQVHAVVKRLRRKLSEIEAPITIQVVRGTGFRAVPLRQLEAVSTPVHG